MAGSAWPSRAATTWTGTPDSSRVVAWMCRRSCTGLLPPSVSCCIKLYYSANMNQPASALSYSQLSDQLEQLSAELPGSTAQVLAFASKEQIAARTAKAQEDAFADACA